LCQPPRKRGGKFIKYCRSATSYWNELIAKPRVNATVNITSISSGAQIATYRTDAGGFVSTYLQSFLYTPTMSEYVGGYLVNASSYGSMRHKTIRIDVQGPHVRPNHLLIVLPIASWPQVFTEHPSSGETCTLTYQNATLEVYGYSTDQGEFAIQSMRMRLYPEGDSAGDWPTISLERSDILLSQVKDPNDRWGKYFPPEVNSNKWRFFHRYTIISGDRHYSSGGYVLEVTVSDGEATGKNTTHFSMLVRDNSPPNIILATDLGRVDWNSTEPLTLSGTSGDDHGVLRVEVRVDAGAWEVANGTSPWSFRLDMGSLAEGFHTIEVRASDGESVSPTVSHTFTIDRPEAHPDGGGDGTPPLAVWIAIVIAFVAIILLAVVLPRRRKQPKDREGK